MPYKDPLDPRARESRLKHYYSNKEQYYERKRAREVDMLSWIAAVKDVPCMDCEIKYPHYVMDFDHRDPTQKLANIGRLVKNGNWNKLKDEIAKCDVVCSNCHRERTWGQDGQRQTRVAQ